MSQFYINSVKKKMKWQKLDLDNLQDSQIPSTGGGYNSPEETIQYEESADREDAISDLRKRLHDDFSHILDDNIGVSLNLDRQENISHEENKENNLNSSELNEAVTILTNIEEKTDFDHREEKKINNLDSRDKSPKILLKASCPLNSGGGVVGVCYAFLLFLAAPRALQNSKNSSWEPNGLINFLGYLLQVQSSYF